MNAWRDCAASLFDGGLFALLLVLIAIVALPGCASTQRTHEEKRISRDDDRDGVVEAVISLFEYRGALYGAMIHISCSDGFTHRVDFIVYRSPLLGLPILWQRWTVDEELTHQERVRMFGPGYRFLQDPFETQLRDPWTAEAPTYE